MKDNYTPEELRELFETAVQVGFAVIAASKSGVVGTFDEMRALVGAPEQIAQATYPANALIKAMVPDDPSAELSPDLSKPSLKGPHQLKQEAIEACAAAAQLLADKEEGDEAGEYKAWVLHIGESVAGAAKESMNPFANAISHDEKAVLRDCAKALGVEYK
ncbi:MAG: hypothetical protein U0641_10975 [Anaerolineae bacterium]